MQPSPSNTMTARNVTGSGQLSNSARHGNGTAVNVGRRWLISGYAHRCWGNWSRLSNPCAHIAPAGLVGKQPGSPQRPCSYVRWADGVIRLLGTGQAARPGQSGRSTMAGTSTLSSDRRPRHVADGASGVGPRRRGLARRRAVLEARWRETLERVTDLSVAYHDAAATRLRGAPAWSQSGFPPAGRGNEDVSRLAQRVVAERQALAEIEAALDRIATGDYGRCEQCHRAISAGLLTAQPEARFCSACSRRCSHVVAYA